MDSESRLPFLVKYCRVKAHYRRVYWPVKNKSEADSVLELQLLHDW
jgi:hypothetical protein